MNSEELACPGRKQCPFRTRHVYCPRQALALLIVLMILGSSWWLVVHVEQRAPTIFEVAFATSAIIGLLLQPIELLSLIRNFLLHEK